MQSPAPHMIHSLTAMMRIIDKAEAHAAARNIKPEVIPNLRLIADMLPFWRQITIACDHAKGACGRLSGIEVPSFADAEMTLAELQDRIAKTIAFVEAIPHSAFDGAEARQITVKAGPRELSFAAPAYLLGFALPNFYFHLTTAYNILRSHGVAIGKGDFLGG